MAAFAIDELLKEISADSPSGPDLKYDPAFMAMETEAKGTPERQVGATIEPGIPPNWKTLKKTLVELMEKTRDLRLLVELARAELNLDGLEGLRDGLSLLRQSVEVFWETIHPQLDPDDDNDPTERINTLLVLCDRESFLLPLLNAPLVESRMAGRFSLRDVQLAIGKISVPAGQTAPQLTLIQGAFSDVPPEIVGATYANLQACLQDVNGLENFVTDKLGVGNSPSFAPVRDMLKEALHFVGEQVERLGIGKETESGASEEGESAPDAAGAVESKKPAPGVMGGINNRQDVVRALELVCEYYAKNEPSSPVPLLVQRAKRLVTMDFMEILQDLAPSGISQVEIIKGPDPGTA